MTINGKTLAVCMIGSLVAGAALVYKSGISVKEQSDTKEDRVIEIIEKPDGSKNTKIVERIINREKKSIEVRPIERDWTITGGAGLNSELQPVYMLGVSRRVFSTVSVGVWGTTNKEAGLSLSVQF
jgi:hypothetical protein